MSQQFVPHLYKDQPVLVESGVVGPSVEVVALDVLEDVSDYRHGFIWIGGRQAEVFQRYPDYDPSYEWVFSKWVDL